MDILDSVRRAVRHYPGGVDAVAARLGKSGSTLEKELRAAYGFKLGALDAAEIAAMCVEQGGEGGLEYPTRLAEAVGATLLLLPRDTEKCDTVTAQSLARLMREFSEVVTAVAEAEADGQVSRNELLSVERLWATLVCDGQKLMRHMGERHESTMARWRSREQEAELPARVFDAAPAIRRKP